jgi:amino acid transporter
VSDEELAKDLGSLSALTIGIGTMIGAGVFVLPGVAANSAGPVVVVSFVVGGSVAMVNALSVSELGTAMPKAGGDYYYVNRVLGPRSSRSPVSAIGLVSRSPRRFTEVQGECPGVESDNS